MAGPARSSTPSPFGTSFTDSTTGLRFEVHHPQERPDLWKRYLDGAEARYAKHNLSSALGRRAIEEGNGVSLFFVGFDSDGDIAAGVRCHGPLETTSGCQALTEMSASSEIDLLARTVEAALPYGVIELKGAWGGLRSTGLHTMGLTLARCTVHALMWLRAELALGAVAERLKGTAEKAGARMIGTESVPYPSDRFRTILMAWQRPQVLANADAEQIALLRTEDDQLLGDAAAPAGLGGESVGQLSGGWRPIVLDLRVRSDRQVIEQAKGDPSLKVVDRLNAQLEELRVLLPPCPPELLEEPARQVFYPWRNTLVNTLGPISFSTLRLDRNRNKITSEEQDRLRQQSIGIVGMSVGHSVAHLLAMEGLCGELRLADYDAIEVTNLNRIPGTLMDVGVNKAIVAARRIAEIDPYLPVKIYPEGVTRENIEEFMEGLDVVIDECDSLAIKVLIREVARRRRIPVLMETSDRGLFDVERFDLEPGRPLFHGLLGAATSESVDALEPEEHLPLVLKIVEAGKASARGAASLAEVGISLSTWPQLGGDVTLGAATLASAVRRLGRGEQLTSGRVRVDLEEIMASMVPPSPSPGIVEGVPDGATYREVPADPVRAIAHAASLAPSGGNVQPWCLEVTDKEFRIYLDPMRSKTMDVNYRGSYVGIGAALFNARVAAASNGRLGEFTVFPNGEDLSQPVAVLELGHGSDPELASWHTEMIGRTSNRHRGVPSPISESTRIALREAAEKEGVLLHLVTDPGAKAECGRLLAEADRMRFLTPLLHSEMLSELKWPGRDSLDTGIDVRTLELGPTELEILGIASRGDVMAYLADWGGGQALGMSSFTAVAASSALAVVSVQGRSARDFVLGGMGVERVWLAAEREGLGVSPVSPVFLYAAEESSHAALVGSRQAERLSELAQQFNEAIGAESDESLLLVYRLSHVPPPSALSRRLPLDEVCQGL